MATAAGTATTITGDTPGGRRTTVHPGPALQAGGCGRTAAAPGPWRLRSAQASSGWTRSAPYSIASAMPCVTATAQTMTTVRSARWSPSDRSARRLPSTTAVDGQCKRPLPSIRRFGQGPGAGLDGRLMWCSTRTVGRWRVPSLLSRLLSPAPHVMRCSIARQRPPHAGMHRTKVTHITVQYDVGWPLTISDAPLAGHSHERANWSRPGYSHPGLSVP